MCLCSWSHNSGRTSVLPEFSVVMWAFDSHYRRGKATAHVPSLPVLNKLISLKVIGQKVCSSSQKCISQKPPATSHFHACIGNHLIPKSRQSSQEALQNLGEWRQVSFAASFIFRMRRTLKGRNSEDRKASTHQKARYSPFLTSVPSKISPIQTTLMQL